MYESQHYLAYHRIVDVMLDIRWFNYINLKPKTTQLKHERVLKLTPTKTPSLKIIQNIPLKIPQKRPP